MASNYKKLGDYISPVDIRNSDNSHENLLGVSVAKTFMPSIANTIGTDFHNYKVVKRGQFVYIPDTSRRGDKIAIALLKDHEKGLVSNIYTVFEVISNDLLPEYLELWFKRSEFDRYARFKSHGSAREIFDWEQMCSVNLPIPTVGEQKIIVKLFSTINERITAVEQSCTFLEDVANAFFKAYFLADASLCPTRKKMMSELAMVTAGGDRPADCQDFPSEDCCCPVYSNGTEQDGLYGYTSVARITRPSVTVSARGTIGFTCLRRKPYFPIVRLISATPTSEVSAEYLYLWLKNAAIIGVGSTQQQLTLPMFKQFEVDVPDETGLSLFNRIINPLFDYIGELRDESSTLRQLSETLIQTLMEGKIDVSSINLTQPNDYLA